VGPGSRYAQICWDRSLYTTIAPHLPGPPDLRHEVDRDPLIGQLAQTLVSEIGAGTADRLLADSLVAAIAMRLVQRQGALAGADARVPDMARQRLQRVLDHIEAHLGSELSLVELAGVACLNPCHLSKSFKEAMGVGPQRYVTGRRIERAKALLARSGLPLVAIAQDLGFSDQSHFTNVFRREVGTTPARFRAQAAG
jgi:AraC family transcriptional regulator